MILYTVYKADWECPEVLFYTFDKDKAYNFINEYNKYSDVNDNMDRYFIKQLNLDNVENDANEVLKKFILKRITYISFKSNQFFIEFTKVKYTNDVYEYVKIHDFDKQNNSYSSALIKLITESSNVPDINNVTIQNYIYNLLSKEILKLKNLYEE